MKAKEIEQARVYAESLVFRAELCGHGSLQDIKLILAAIVELQSLRACPQALRDAQRAA